jgi:hypothetical protein
MKLLKFIVLIFGFLTFTSCDYNYSFVFSNNSTHDVCLFFGIIDWDFNRALYPDTAIIGSMGEVYRHGESKIYTYSDAREDTWTNTICLFIFDKDTMNTYSWKQIQDDYKVLQRYDLSPENLQTLKYQISYPPTEAMKNMKMYPPYGSE